MIPLILGTARLFSVAARALPVIIRVGAFVGRIPGVASILRFSARLLRPLAKIAPWLRNQIPWLFAGIGAEWLVKMASVVTRGLETAWHYDWGKTEAQLLSEMKSSLISLYSPLGETLGRSVAAIIVGRGLGGGAGIPKVRINCAQIASLIEISGGTEAVRETLIDAVADLWSSVRSAAQGILLRFLHLNGKRMVEKQMGKKAPQTGTESFVFAEKFEEKIQKVFPDENISQAVIDGFEAFFDTLGDLLTEQDTYAEFV